MSLLYPQRDAGLTQVYSHCVLLSKLSKKKLEIEWKEIHDLKKFLKPNLRFPILSPNHKKVYKDIALSSKNDITRKLD